MEKPLPQQPSKVIPELVARTASDDKDETSRGKETGESTSEVLVGDIRIFRTERIKCRYPLYKGTFEEHLPVAVKLIDLGTNQNTKFEEYRKLLREVEILRRTPRYNHPSIIRFFKSEIKDKTLYIAVELCQASLKDYVKDDRHWSRKDLPLKVVLGQMTNGLMFLHDIVNIAHRHLKPSNILIHKSEIGTKLVIADFAQSKFLTADTCSVSREIGSAGWIAPEILEPYVSGTVSEPEPETKVQIGTVFRPESDIFSLGSIFYYVISKGKSAWGQNDFNQLKNLLAGTPDLSGIPAHQNYLQELVADMVALDPERRPSAKFVLENPALWDDTVIMKFLHKASNQINNYPPTQQNMLEDPIIIPGGNWVQRLPINTSTYLATFTLAKHPRPMFQGKEGSVRHLLRAIRNCSEHFKELAASMRAEMGDSTQDHVQFWLSHFPLLFMHVYRRMSADQDLMKSVFD